MPKFLEDKLKAEYGQKSKVPYEVMNKMGVMRGNKETAKGMAMQRKHDSKLSKSEEEVAEGLRKITPKSAARIRARVNGR